MFLHFWRLFLNPERVRAKKGPWQSGNLLQGLRRSNPGVGMYCWLRFGVSLNLDRASEMRRAAHFSWMCKVRCWLFGNKIPIPSSCENRPVAIKRMLREFGVVAQARSHPKRTLNSNAFTRKHQNHELNRLNSPRFTVYGVR